MAVLGVDGRRGCRVGALLTDRAVRLLVLDDMAAVLADARGPSAQEVRDLRCRKFGQELVSRRTIDSGSTRSSRATGRQGHSGT